MFLDKLIKDNQLLMEILLLIYGSFMVQLSKSVIQSINGGIKVCTVTHVVTFHLGEPIIRALFPFFFNILTSKELMTQQKKVLCMKTDATNTFFVFYSYQYFMPSNLVLQYHWFGFHGVN